MRAKGTSEMDKLHLGAVKRYHTLCSALRLTPEDREALLAPYGVTSSKDMETHDLVDLCGSLALELDKRTAGVSLDKLRKRVMAAIGAWLITEGRYSSVAIIKAIACRATGYRSFNKIPKERLRNLIGLFNNKSRDKAQAEQLKTLITTTTTNQLAN
ncbi:hypothetical protein [Porphyromonas catoniae]|jgi:hypothetical protein|nr:hypothetical protein [Porphyromonas catoniae]DAV05700.1 MAG TPA: Protein of unknown function (DUF1018) [Caudoviricetes sp.]